MTFDLQAMLCIEVLLLVLQKLTFGRLKTQISMLNLPKLNSKMGKISYSIAGLRVAISQWLFRVGENEFDIYMRVDTNTNGHRQWFYFSVKNLLPGIIKFNVFRFKKKFSLFQRGMKPYVRSIKQKLGWKPAGNKIMYRCEKQPTQYGVAKQKNNYFLTFQYKFKHPQDEVYFCSGLPYTVTLMRTRLDTFCASHMINGVVCKATSIGKSMCGQDLPLLTIQSSEKTYNKNYIVINARTHAGETSCSWVLDGLIQRIVANQEIQEWIQKNEISFKIIPMLNIDGVYMGNYRTGIMGEDFNRKFSSGKKQIFPQIFALKKVVSQCKKNGKLFMYLDLHGHSILKNSFIYGPIESLFQNNPLRNLSFTLWHGSKYFRLSSCKFRFQKDLTETSRVYFQIRDSILTYTCEISLGLYIKNGQTLQFMQNDYKSFGSCLADSFVELMTDEKIKNYVPKIEQNEKMVPFQQINNEKRTSKKKEVVSRLPSFKKQKQMCLQRIKKAHNQIQEQSKGKIKKGNQKNESESRQKQRQSKLQRIVNRNPMITPDRDEFQKNIQTKIKAARKKFSVAIQKTDVNSSKTISSNNKSALPFNNTIKSNNLIRKEKVEAEQKRGIFQVQKSTNKITFEEKKSSKNDQQLPRSLKKTTDPQESERMSKYSAQEPVNREQKEVGFKIRRKSDILKVLPESLRKKVVSKGVKNLNSTYKYFGIKKQEQQGQFMFQRSVTYDPSYNLREQNEMITQPNELQQINQNFSEDYSSINDSDSPSDDLCEKQKQYLLECIRNNRKLHTHNNQNEAEQESEEESEQNDNTCNKNINRFKEIRFKSIEPMVKFQSSGHQNARLTKRDPHKFRDFNYKSLNKNHLQDEEAPNIVQRKQLNQRVHRKTQRQPYFLIQIKSKNNN